MKRLRRIIFNALTVLSLLLCLATAVLWWRSYYVCDCINRFTVGGGAEAVSAKGMVTFCSWDGALLPSQWAYSRGGVTHGT